MEIERKFLLDSFPDNEEYLELLTECIVRQSYLEITELIEVRIIKKIILHPETDAKYIMSVKSTNEGLARVEVEKYITEDEYEELRSLVSNKKSISKQYKEYLDINNNIQIDVSRIDNTFVYAEVEFTSEDDAESFIPYTFMNEDVTHESKYRMCNYFNFINKYN